MATKLKIFSPNQRFRQSSGEVDGSVTRERGRKGSVFSNAGNPFIEDAKPRRLPSFEALKTVELPKPSTDRQVGLFFKDSLFGVATKPDPVNTRQPETNPEDIEGRMGVSGMIYDVAHDKGIAAAEKEAHRLDNQWSLGLLAVMVLEIIIFGIIAILKTKG